MRHGKKFNHLGRTASHRKALLSNMACSLIEHKRINTTVAKAKALRVYIEKKILHTIEEQYSLTFRIKKQLLNYSEQLLQKSLKEMEDIAESSKQDSDLEMVLIQL